MSLKSTNDIIQLLEQNKARLYDLTANNPLVDVSVDTLLPISEVGDNRKTKHLFQQMRHFEKEYALDTLLYCSHWLRWIHPDKKQFYTSPLWCRRAHLEEKKREEKTFNLLYPDDDWFLNPVLKKLFIDHFAIDLSSASSLEDILHLLRTEFQQITESKTFDQNQQWSIVKTEALGIFNYRKLQLSDDYDTLMKQPGGAVTALLGASGTTSETLAQLKPTGSIVDPSQALAIQTAMHHHVVIQGPPGTGKSHTIAALIKSLLLEQKKVLFVSEKRAALEVVYDRLKEEKLQLQIAFFGADKKDKQHFYANLKKIWQKSLDTKAQLTTRPAFSAPNFAVVYPAKLIDTNNPTGASIQQILDQLIALNSQPFAENLNGIIPSYSDWHEHLEQLIKTEAILNERFQSTSVHENVFFRLNTVVFRESNFIQKLITRLDQMTHSLRKITDLSTDLNIPLSPQEFLRLAIAASILNMVNKTQLDLLVKDSKKFKSFNTLSKKYRITQNKLSQAEIANQSWEKKPSIAEITALTDILKQSKKTKGILGILKRNSAKSHDYFAGFPVEISTVTKLQLLEQVRTEWHLRGELQELKIKLQHDLNLSDPDRDIEHILQVRSKLNAVSQNEYLQILEHDQSHQLIEKLAAIHPVLNRAITLWTYLFHDTDFASFDELNLLLKKLENDIPIIENSQYELSQFYQLPEVIINFIRSNGGTVSQLDERISWHHLNQLTRFEPAFKTLSGDKLSADFNEERKRLNLLQETQTERIHHEISNWFRASEKLLDTAPSKLKSDQKGRRKKFKEFKRILAHESTKSRQHLAVKELLNTCHETILNLQPLWMMSPLSVSQLLPCETALFDHVIFDESSQIPLEDAIPAVYRARCITVVGDSQQMPPGRFFTSSEESQTLLDVAEFNFKNVMLKNHYRSQHPALIEFSNHHFYDSELQVLPPADNKCPIALIRVNGVFENQQNINEAIEIANYYEQLQRQGKTDIAILTFSQEQQKAIELQLQKKKLPVNENLVLRNLENSQGIEKDVVLISVGYAKNKDGIFHKRFGPLNQQHGSNRLNVLLTRAKKQMVIFTSANASDFGWSENRGANLLSEFIAFAEKQTQAASSDQPIHSAHNWVSDFLRKNEIPVSFYSTHRGNLINCFIQHHTSKILLVDPCTLPDESKDLFSVLNILRNRFKEIKILLSTQILYDRVLAEKDLLRFFN